ncbi:MAG: ABC-F family ATP-binding cassette domain-containing protein [Bacteriovoracaceae bacterium]|nr:ABC-F family ATP-binding cassette domain-containing protein [Bacteriovoracaceae bacterium]
MSVICSLKNLSLSFGDKIIFDNASFQIDHGDKIGLIGLNGVGKSSLFKVLNGEVGADSTSQFIFDKASSKQGSELEYTVFLVEQNFTMPKNKCSAREYLFEYYPELKKLNEEYKKTIESEDLTKQEKVLTEMERVDFWSYQNAYESYLKSFDLEDPSRDVSDLSGGEQKKILLSLGLVSKANLILWDEPTNHLDIESIKKLEEELLAVGKSLVIISHDRHLLSKVCNKIVHIHDSKITEFRGSYADYLEFLSVKEEQRLQSLAKLKNTLKRETEWMRQGVKARGTRSKKRVEGFEDLSKKVSNLKAAAKKEIELNINASGRKTKKLAAFNDMSFSYGDKSMFNNINLELHKGEKIGVLGPNGAGKTTLMKLLSGELSPTSGEVFLADGLVINYFDQKREELQQDKTPYELLGAGEDFVQFSDGRSLHVSAYFENFLFNKDQLKRPLSSFSGGELNRLQLAINLKNESDVWIFDEPTNDLDIESIEILESKLETFKGTVLLISHDRSFLENVTNKVWLVKDKGIEEFNSGYSQVQAYLDALEIEKSYIEDAQNSGSDTVKIEKSSTDSKVRKLTNKEKEAIKKLPSEIEALENDIMEMEEKISTVDYASLDASASEALNQLVEAKDNAETTLLEKYELLEELQNLQ